MEATLNRFDDRVRSERYFTATLLPAILLHDNFRGLRAFLALLEDRAILRNGSPTERGPDGEAVPRLQQTLTWSPETVELMTEVHIARDLAQLPSPSWGESSEPEKRDAPDLVIVLDGELVVCEGKFFGKYNLNALNAQLRSQRHQIGYLWNDRPELRVYRHVAILPYNQSPNPDCDIVLTWDEIGNLAASVLTPAHYVTKRLRAASKRLPPLNGSGRTTNYEGKLSLGAVLDLCRQHGDDIQVGHEGGLADLWEKAIRHLEDKPWKWRYPYTPGPIIPRNWIPGTQFTAVVTQRLSSGRGQSKRLPTSNKMSPASNYEGILPLGAVLDLCRERGDEIQVGHTGGTTNLRKRSTRYLKNKRWKWRYPNTPGSAIPRNWIPGTQFAAYIAQRVSSDKNTGMRPPQVAGP